MDTSLDAYPRDGNPSFPPSSSSSSSAAAAIPPLPSISISPPSPPPTMPKTPRLFLARHGETPWTLTGQHTSTTDLPLTQKGERDSLTSRHIFVGVGRHIDPSHLAAVFISPRLRAQQTCTLLLGDVHRATLETEGKVHTTEELREWTYGEYEGLRPNEIRERRRREGKGGGFDIWRDGCKEVGGEAPREVEARVDALIERIRGLQRTAMDGSVPGDVLCVAHGHILRAFTKRWLGYEIDFPLQMMLEPGGIGTLSYNHHNIDEPAFLLGAVLPIPDYADEREAAAKEAVIKG